MRESRKTERMHLPKDSGEEWMDLQEPRALGRTHRKAPDNAYDTWLAKRVESKRRHATRTRS